MIELLMAMMIGLLVCVTAFAGFNATSKVLGRANRLALQNQMFAAGVAYAWYDFDTWSSLNDIGNPSTGILHLAVPALADYRQARPFNNLAIGCDYRPDDPKWWYRYALVKPYGLRQPAQDLDFAMFGKRGDPSPGGYLPELMSRIDETLGHYGFFDYWPPGVPLGGADASGEPLPWLRSGPEAIVQGIMALADNNSASDSWPPSPFASRAHTRLVGVVGADFPPSLAVTGGRNRQMYGRSNPVIQMSDFFTYGVPLIRLVPGMAANPVLQADAEGPAGWPDLQVQTRRYLSSSGFRQAASVRLMDHRTGENLIMSFSGTGSSLRGARISRGLDP